MTGESKSEKNDVKTLEAPDKSYPSDKKKPPEGNSVMLFGIILPTAAATFELFTQMCAGIFFDPLPTSPHFLAFMLIPLSNLFCWISIWGSRRKLLPRLGLINGIGIGISLIYTIKFLPIIPFSAIGILFFGVGLFGLAPLFSFASAMKCRRGLKSIIPKTDRPFSKVSHGIAVGIGLLVIVEIPLITTHLGMRMANSDDMKSQAKGIRLLRVFGSENLMLKMCYGDTSDPIASVFLGLLPAPDLPRSLKARGTYYRVTGRAFNDEPRPYASPRTWWRNSDEDRGGDRVAGKVEGLRMSGSRLDGVIHPDAGLSYTEWILVFENRSDSQQEARAQILLPPGGVVSRATLWVDGEEREAAFAGRGEVRRAYEQIVRQRRDPLLVTTKGPDRVLAQCFPVPSRGKMKIRLGITAPLRLEEKEKAILRLPCFVERNFSIPETLRHSVWVESRKPLKTENRRLKAEHPKDSLYALRGMVGDSELSERGIQVEATRDAEVMTSWTPDPASEKGEVIWQFIKETNIAPPPRVILVLDGSRGMRKFIPAIASAIRHLPEEIEFGLILASDMTMELVPLGKGNPKIYRNTSRLLEEMDYEGGQDNIAALSRAWDIAAGKRNSVILWVHGVQPVLLQSTEVLQQKWDRRPGDVRLLDMQITNGPNRVLETLNLKEGIETLAFGGNPGSDLRNLFSAWSGKQKRLTFFRERIRSASHFDPDLETSSHLARLWAYDEILNLHLSGKESARDQAVQLASKYQLVTPVSGAVVLETDRQYDEAGLEPADPDTVPNISAVPEPATLWLVAAGLLMAMCVRRKWEVRSGKWEVRSEK